jgi:hypothetical protein
MPRIQIPSSTVGQGAILNRGGTSQCTLSNLRGTVIVPTIAAPYTIVGSFNNPNYYFWTYIATSNSTKGGVSITYPYSEGPATSAGTFRNVFTGVYSYITIVCNVTYGYSFTYWSASYPGGPVVSYSSTYNLQYYDTYYDASIYANFA